MRPKSFPLVAFALSLTLSPGVAMAQDTPAEAPQVTIESITVEPSSPAADTLCKLTVKLRNQGTEIASQLDFKVSINGQSLPVYRNQLFMFPVPAGDSAEIKLYNFWSTETSRPMPSNGKLEVEVTLAAAQWTKVSMEDEVEVWEPLGEVAGLPQARSITLEMKR